MKKNFWDTFAQQIIQVCFSIVVLLYACVNLLMSVYQQNLIDNVSYYRWNSWFHYLFLAICLYLLYRRQWRFSSKKFLWAFLLLSAVFLIIWISINPQGFGEYADPYNVYRSARAVANGDYGVLGYKTYINTYPNNLGLLSILVIFYKFFQEAAAYFFRFSNIFFVLSAYLFLYKMSEKLFANEDIQRVLVLFFVFTTQWLFYAYYVYGNAMSYSLGIVASYFFIAYLKDRRISQLLIASVSIIVSIFVKNNSAILLVAMVLYLLLDVLNKRKMLLSLITIFCLCAGFWLATEGVIRFYEKKADVNYDNRLPKLAWIAYGSFNYDPKHPGGYLSYFETYHFENDYVAEYTELFIQQHIDRTLARFREKPFLVLEFMARKLAVGWADPEFEALSIYRLPDKGKPGLVEGYPAISQDLVAGKLHYWLHEFWDVGLSLMAIGLLIYWKKEKKELVTLFPAVVVLGGFLFHSFWELKSIYIYQYYLFLLPYGAKGLSLLRKGEHR